MAIETNGPTHLNLDEPVADYVSACIARSKLQHKRASSGAHDVATPFDRNDDFDSVGRRAHPALCALWGRDDVRWRRWGLRLPCHDLPIPAAVIEGFP